MNKGTLKNDTLVLVCSLYWPVRHQVLNILYALYAYSFFLKRKIAFHWPEELYCISLVTNRWHIFVSMQSSSYSVQLSCVQLFATPWITACQACPSPTPGVYPNSCPLSRWCHPTISSSVVPFSFHQYFPASGSFQMSEFFTSGGQNIEVAASASVLPMNIQDWFPLGWTGWISLQSKGLSRVFSDITVQRHQFFGAQLSL